MITFMNTRYKKILILRQGAIGDVVHTTNIFRSIKTKHPEVEIDYLTGKVPYMLLEHDTRLNRVIKLEGKDYKYLTKLGLELRKEKYDLLINLQPSLRYQYLAFLINPKATVTYKKSFRYHAVENFWQTAKKKFHDIENFDNLELQIPEDVREKVKAEIGTDKKTVVLNTQTSLTRQGRKWSYEYFKELAFSLIDRYDCTILISGSKDDIEETKAYENLHPNMRMQH